MRNQVMRRYPNIRFILSHAGGFVPYAATGWPWAWPAMTARPRDTLTDLRSFYFDTALSATPASLSAC